MKWAVTIIAACVLLVAAAFLLQPTTYAHRFIRLKGCPNTFITEIEYSKPFYRGFAYTYGIYNKNALPSSNCIISSKMTGIDSILELWIVCSGDKVTFYPATGSLSLYTKDNANISLGQVEPWEFNRKVIAQSNVVKVTAE